MIGITKAILITLMFFMGSSSLFAQKKTVVSVMDFEAVGVDKSVSSQLTSAMVSHLVELGTFKIVDRDQIEAVMKEQSLQQTAACNDEACMVEMGQLLGVQLMVFGKIGKLEDNYTLNVKLLEVETGEIKKSKFYMHEGTLSELFRDKSKGIITDLFDAKPKEAVVKKDPKKEKNIESTSINKPDFSEKKDAENGESKIGKRVVQGILGAVAIGGGVFGFFNEASLKTNLENYNKSTDEKEATEIGDKMDDNKLMRNIGYITASVATVSFAVVTFTF